MTTIITINKNNYMGKKDIKTDVEIYSRKNDGLIKNFINERAREHCQDYDYMYEVEDIALLRAALKDNHSKNLFKREFKFPEGNEEIWEISSDLSDLWKLYRPFFDKNNKIWIRVRLCDEYKNYKFVSFDDDGFIKELSTENCTFEQLIDILEDIHQKVPYKQ